MFTISAMYGTIAEVEKKISNFPFKSFLTSYVDVENGVMYLRECCGNSIYWQVLYNSDGKPKLFSKLEELQKLFKKNYGISIEKLYD